MAHTIIFKPERTSYTIRGSDSYDLFNVAGGGPRMRRDKSRANHVVDLEWKIIGSTDYRVLMLAWEQYSEVVWEVWLLSGADGYAQFNCLLLPGTFRLQRQVGSVYVVGASLEILGAV